jgi:hypothetical protein
MKRPVQEELPEIIRQRVQQCVYRAIREGVLVIKPCEVCGAHPTETQSNGRTRRGVVAHHDDYNQPLNVRWLCKPCHIRWHARNASIRPRPKIARLTAKHMYPYALADYQAKGERAVPKPVEKLMAMLAEKDDRP